MKNSNEIIKVYEQLLAQNPAYRKEIGAFYTPAFIVNYMVEQCFKAFAEKSYSEICQVRLIDPACGGGAFLVGAYQYLLDYHSQKRNKVLTLAERKEILFNQILGVDIDEQALQVCKQALLMVCYGVENPSELDTSELNQNIKCGNSLVSRFPINADLADGSNNGSKSKWNVEAYKAAVATYRDAQNKEQKREMERLIADIKADFRTKIAKNDPKLVRKRKLEGELFNLMYQTTAFESQQEKQVKAQKVEALQKEIEKVDAEIQEIENNKIFENAFEWRFEFPEVLDDNGNFVGFDIVIGNPPYISNKEIQERQKSFFAQTYQTAQFQYDLFSIFIEKSLSLLKPLGVSSFIVPDSFLGRGSFRTIREYLYRNATITKLFHINDVFTEAHVSSCVYFLRKFVSDKHPSIEYVKTNNVQSFLDKQAFTKQINYLTYEKINSFRLLFIDQKELELLVKLFNNVAFGDYIDIWRGEEIGKRSDIILSFYERKDDALPIIAGENIERYRFKGGLKYIQRKNVLKDLAKYEKPKIVIRQLGNQINATISNNKEIVTQSVYCICATSKIYSNELILALLNSKLIHFIYRCVFAEKQEFPRILIENINNMVLPKPNPIIFNSITNLVHQILSLKQQTPLADTTALENQIDRLVYELYGLTEEEIKIMEQNGNIY